MTREATTVEDWQRLYETIASRLRAFGGFSIVMRLQSQQVRFYLRSRYDLSGISEGLEGFVIRPVTSESLDPATPSVKSRRKWMFRPRLQGNLLQVSERAKVLWSAQFEVVELRVHRFGTNVVTRVACHFTRNDKARRVAYLKAGFPADLLAIDFAKSSGYLKRPIPKYVSIEKTAHLLSARHQQGLFLVDTFPYLPRNYFLNLSKYDFDKHSLVIGSTGSGKSKFIELFVDRVRRFAPNGYHLIVIDPHLELAQNLAEQGPARVIDFKTDATQIFPDANADVSAATEFTVALLISLMNERENGHLERVLRFSVYVLNVAQVMALDNLKRFLTDLDYRKQMLSHTDAFVSQSIKQFFATDFNDVRTTHYNTAIQPIVALTDELALQPAIAGDHGASLAETVRENFLTVFALNKVSMGNKAVKTVAGLLLQQIFLLCQARVFDRKVILIIDEVSVVQNPTMASILSEARKFGLTVMLSQQYFDQIESDLQKSILSNTTNYYVFKVSENDANTLARNVLVDIPLDVLQRERLRGNDDRDVRANLMSELNPRECLVRVSANGRMLPAMLGRTCTVKPSKSFASSSFSTPLPSKPPRFVYVDDKVDQAIDEQSPRRSNSYVDLRSVFARQSAGRRAQPNKSTDWPSQ